MDLHKMRIVLTDGEDEVECLDHKQLAGCLVPSVKRSAYNVGQQVIDKMVETFAHQVMVVEVVRVESIDDVMEALGFQRIRPEDN